MEALNTLLNLYQFMSLVSEELNHPIEIESYVGHFNPKEVANISHHADRLLIHSYVQEPNRIFPYIKKD